jgi:hypothetical protein
MSEVELCRRSTPLIAYFALRDSNQRFAWSAAFANSTVLIAAKNSSEPLSSLHSFHDEQLAH